MLDSQKLPWTTSAMRNNQISHFSPAATVSRVVDPKFCSVKAMKPKRKANKPPATSTALENEVNYGQTWNRSVKIHSTPFPMWSSQKNIRWLSNKARSHLREVIKSLCATQLPTFRLTSIERWRSWCSKLSWPRIRESITTSQLLWSCSLSISSKGWWSYREQFLTSWKPTSITADLLQKQQPSSSLDTWVLGGEIGERRTASKICRGWNEAPICSSVEPIGNSWKITHQHFRRRQKQTQINTAWRRCTPVATTIT